MAGNNSSNDGTMSREEAGRLGGQAYHEKRGNHGSDSSSDSNAQSSNRKGNKSSGTQNQ